MTSPAIGTAATGIATSRSTDGTRVIRRRRRRPRWVSHTIAIVFSLVWVFPVYWMLNTAFKPRDEVMTPTPIFWPRQLTFQNFIVAISQADFFDDLRNSVIVVFSSVILSVVVGMFASAALTRFRFRSRRPLMLSILIIQMLPPTAMIIPMFLIFNDVGLIGNYAGLILAYVALVLPFSIWVMRGFFITIPVELEEAAEMDGASTWRVLWSVLFPLVMPGVIATSVFAFVTAWNDYIFAYTFMKDQTMYTLPVWLASFSTPTGTDFGSQMAASVLFCLPAVVFFMIVQRRLVTGMSAGAVKG
jgi:N,N'-diacetylchitobiose transport system permease protein